MNPTNRVAVVVGGLVLMVSIAGCADGATEASAPATGGTVSTAPATTADSQPAEDSVASVSEVHNEADVTFAQMMTIHHEGALEMATLAAEKADSEDVKDLAVRIEAAQLPEIELMESWLKGWDEPLEPEGHEGMDMGNMDMDGMSQEDVMAELEQKTGPDFDSEFLTAMIAHHEGAVGMSEEELSDGENVEAKDLAQRIIDAQQDEIQEMQQLLS